MTDTVQTSAEDSGRKPLGRNQRLAIACYSVGYGAVTFPMFVTLGVAIYRNDMPTVLTILDKLATFTQVYGLVAIASILVVSGAIKGVGAVAGAIRAKASA